MHFNFYGLDNLLNNYEICFWKIWFSGLFICIANWMIRTRGGSFNRSSRRYNGIINPNILDEGMLVLGIPTAFWWWSYGSTLLAFLEKDFHLSLLQELYIYAMSCFQEPGSTIKIKLLISLCLQIANFTIYNNLQIKINFTFENKISSNILQTSLECRFNVQHETNNKNKTQLTCRILFEPTYYLQNQLFLSSAESCTISNTSLTQCKKLYLIC